MPRPVTLLPRAQPVSLRTDAAADGEPAELKHTRGERRQTDELDGDPVFGFHVCLFQREANTRSVCEG